MSISPPTKSKPPIYDFDEATVSTPDDDAFQPYTQRSPIIINTASPVILAALRGKKASKRVHFDKQNFCKTFKTEEADKTSAHDSQLIGS